MRATLFRRRVGKASARVTGNAAMKKRPGLTLMELLVVIVVVLVLAGIAIPLFSGAFQMTVGKDANGTAITKSPQQVATESTMERLRDIIAGTPERPGYWTDLLASGTDPTPTPLTLKDLFVVNPALPVRLQQFDPNTRRGWRGPYLLSAPGKYAVSVANGFTTTYGQPGEATVPDAWGRPIVIQWPTGDPTGRYVRLVSAGVNGTLDTPLTDLPATTRGDDIVLFLRQALP